LGSLEWARSRPLSIVPYAGFLEDSSRYLSDIVAKHGGISPSDNQWSEALASVRPGLRRQASRENDLANYPSLIGETLDYCTSSVHDERRHAALLAEFESWLEILEPPRLSGTRIGFAWTQGGEIYSVQEPYLPIGDWQTVRLQVAAPARTELHGLFYSKACRVWIRRCVFLHGSGETAAQLTPGPGSNLAQINGIQRLEGAYEARQISLSTPSGPGPFTLEIEFLLESGTQIVNDAASRISSRLHECASKRAVVERRLAARPTRPR